MKALCQPKIDTHFIFVFAKTKFSFFEQTFSKSLEIKNYADENMRLVNQTSILHPRNF